MTWCVLACRCWLAAGKLYGSHHVGNKDAWLLQSPCHDWGPCSPGIGADLADCQVGVPEVHWACHSGLLPIHLEFVLFRIYVVTIFVRMHQSREDQV